MVKIVKYGNILLQKGLIINKKYNGLILYYINGKKYSFYNLVNNNHHGLEFELDENTSKLSLIKKIINNKKFGYFIRYYTSGNIYDICYYENDLKNGLYLHYYDNKKIMELCYYKNNLKNGLYTV